jgi:hypothetical protein
VPSNVNRHGIARCVSVKRASLMVTVAVRDRGRSLLATASRTAPSPCPDVGDIDTHGSLAAAAHKQSRSVFMVAVASVASASTTSGTPFTVPWQRPPLAALGAESSSTTVLPQATKREIARTARAIARRCPAICAATARASACRSPCSAQEFAKKVSA